MAFPSLPSPVPVSFASGLNDSTHFHNDAEVSEDESDLEEDVLMEMNNDNADDSCSVGSDNEEDTPESNEEVWSEQPQNVIINSFTEENGPKHPLPPDAKPFEYFSLFIEEEFYEYVADQTNLYARYKKETKPNCANQWKECTAEDIKLFLFVNMMFGVHQLPQYDMFWSSDDLLRVPAVAEAMSKIRYENLNRFFHMNDSSVQQHDKIHPDYDPIFKVRPLFDMVLENSQKYYQPSENVSIEEAVIASSRRSHFKQPMKGRRYPRSIKARCYAESKTGYLFDYSICTGKSQSKQKIKHGQVDDVVMNNGGNLLSKNHYNIYKHYSMDLAADPLPTDTYSCASIRPKDDGWPDDLKKNGKAPAKSTEFQQKENMLVTNCKGNRGDTVLSTNCDSKMGAADPCSSIPQPLLTYNASVSGVDLFNKYSSYYPIGRRCNKWWRSIVWFLLQIAIINAYILYSASSNAPKKFSHLEFRMEVIRALRMGKSARLRRTSEAPSRSGQANGKTVDHQIVRLHGRKMQCYQCRVEKRRTVSNRGVETVFGCSICKVHLCKGHCFASFHNNL